METIKMTEEEKERLQRRVQHRIETMSAGKATKKSRLKALAMAAAAGLVLLPAGGYAAGKIADFYKESAKQDGYQVEVAMEKNQTDGISKEKHWVKLSCDLPEGYTMKTDTQDIGWYDLVWKDGWDCGKNISFSLMQADTKEGKSLRWDNVKEAEDMTVSGNKATYLHFSGIEKSIYEDETERQTDYTHALVVFYEEQGYVVEYYAMKGVSRGELMQMAERVRLINCKEEEADAYCLLSEEYPASSSKGESEPFVIPGTAENSIDAGKVYGAGETVSYDGLDYTVKDVQALDSIAGLKEECFNDCMDIMGRKNEFCESDGKLKRYTRETVEYGDGYRTPYEKVVDSKKVSLKFVKVQMEVVNRTHDEVEYQACRPLDCLLQNDRGYQLNPKRFHRPSVIGDCMLDHLAQYYEQTAGGKKFYMDTLEAGERTVVTIGYFVDEDLINSSYITLGDVLSEQKYISLKK